MVLPFAMPLIGRFGQLDIPLHTRCRVQTDHNCAGGTAVPLALYRMPWHLIDMQVAASMQTGAYSLVLGSSGPFPALTMYTALLLWDLLQEAIPFHYYSAPPA